MAHFDDGKQVCVFCPTGTGRSLNTRPACQTAVPISHHLDVDAPVRVASGKDDV